MTGVGAGCSFRSTRRSAGNPPLSSSRPSKLKASDEAKAVISEAQLLLLCYHNSA